MHSRRRIFGPNPKYIRLHKVLSALCVCLASIIMSSRLLMACFNYNPPVWFDVSVMIISIILFGCYLYVTYGSLPSVELIIKNGELLEDGKEDE